MRAQKLRPYKDERDREIAVHSKGYALEFTVAAAQILTIFCLVKGNPAWKGSLALLFFGCGAELFYKYRQYEAKPYLFIGAGLGLIGAVLLLWFGFSG